MFASSSPSAPPVQPAQNGTSSSAQQLPWLNGAGIGGLGEPSLSNPHTPWIPSSSPSTQPSTSSSAVAPLPHMTGLTNGHSHDFSNLFASASPSASHPTRPASSFSLEREGKDKSSFFNHLSVLSQPPRPASHPNGIGMGLLQQSSASAPSPSPLANGIKNERQDSLPPNSLHGGAPGTDALSLLASQAGSASPLPLSAPPSHPSSLIPAQTKVLSSTSSPAPLSQPSQPQSQSVPQQNAQLAAQQQLQQLMADYLRSQGLDTNSFLTMSQQEKERHKTALAALQMRLRAQQAQQLHSQTATATATSANGTATVNGTKPAGGGGWAGLGLTPQKQAQMIQLRKIAGDHVRKQHGIERAPLGVGGEGAQEVEIGTLYAIVRIMGGGSAMLTKNGAWPTVCQMMQVRKDEVGVKALVEVYAKYLLGLEKTHTNLRRAGSHGSGTAETPPLAPVPETPTALNLLPTPTPTAPATAKPPTPPTAVPSTSMEKTPEAPAIPSAPESQKESILSIPPPPSTTEPAPKPSPPPPPSLPTDSKAKAPENSPSVPPLASSPSVTTKRPSTALEEPEPVRPKKRYRVTYNHLTRTTTAVGGWELRALDALTNKVRPPRTGLEGENFGVVDIHSLTMSLKSRMAHEVTYALNVLQSLGMSMGTEGSVPFPLHQCEDLGEELLDLLDECLGSEMVGLSGGKGKEREKRYAWEEWRGRSFGRLKRMGEEESVRLLDSKGKKKDVSYSLGRVETVLAILNFFRNVTTAEDVGRFCASLPRFAELLLRPCILEANFAAKRAKAGGGGVDLDLKVSDLLTIRKDVAFIFSSVGLDVELTTTNGWVADAVVELLSWFLDLTNELDEGWMGRGKEKGGAGAGANGPPIHRLSYTTEIALLALAKISTKDPNREVIAASLDSAKVEDVIDRLKFYIPIQEDSLTVVPAFESGIVTLEFLTISMFNFIFLSKPSLKRKLTLKTDLVKSILSLVQRIMPKFPTHPGESMPPQMACRVPVCQRCLDILRCLNESISDSSDVQTKEDGAVWFGGGFVDEEAEDETIFKAEKKTPALLADHVNAISWINSSKHPPKNIVSDLQSLCYSLN